MVIVSRKFKAEKASHLWKKSYYDSKKKKWGDLISGSAEEVFERLCDLGPSPNPDDVNAVIKNTSWTDCTCSECRKAVETVVQLGEEPDYESSTAWICIDCLRSAVALVESR